MPHERSSSGHPGSVNNAAPGPRGDLDAWTGADMSQPAAKQRASESDPRPTPADDGAKPRAGASPESLTHNEADESVGPSAPRRLPPPPWQLHTGIRSHDFGERFESARPGAVSGNPEVHPPAHRAERSDPGTGVDEPLPAGTDSWEQVAADSDEYTEPVRSHAEWHQGAPPPLGWMMPPPGWLPPPPGWTPPPPDDAQAAAPPNYQPPQGFRVPPSLDEAELVHRTDEAPQSGWRRAMHRASGGRINPGESRKVQEKEHLLGQIRRPIVGDFRIAVLSVKGGVGKTTTTLGLGSALAMVRTDRIIAVDANPDRGTLAERVKDTSTQSTVRDLLSDDNIDRYADVRSHTRMASSRLEVLASEQEPAVAEVFGEADYRRTVDILRDYYNIILTDCGTGIMHSAMAGVLDLAHTVVLVSSPAIDAARSASATLDWLIQHGHSALVREAQVVLSASRPGSAALKLDKVYEHFEARCRSVHMIPFDPHLAEGAEIDVGLLKPATFDAYLELAGAVAEKFPRLRAGRHRQ